MSTNEQTAWATATIMGLVAVVALVGTALIEWWIGWHIASVLAGATAVLAVVSVALSWWSWRRTRRYCVPASMTKTTVGRYFILAQTWTAGVTWCLKHGINPSASSTYVIAQPSACLRGVRVQAEDVVVDLGASRDVYQAFRIYQYGRLEPLSKG